MKKKRIQQKNDNNKYSGRKTGCPGEHREAALYPIYSQKSKIPTFWVIILHFALQKSVFSDLILHLKKTGLKSLVL